MLDTNTLVSRFGWSGPPSTIVDAVLTGELLLVSSPPLLDELERVLRYRKLAGVFPDPIEIATRVRTIADVIEPGVTLNVVADEPDNRVLEVAVQAGADAIVTGDGGLLAFGSYHGIPIMSPMPGHRPPMTVSILWDRRRLDSREAVMEWLAEVDAKRAEEVLADTHAEPSVDGHCLPA